MAERAASPVPFWTNPEARRAVLSAFLLAAAGALAALLLWSAAIHSAHRQAVERDLAVIGTLALKHPELRDELGRAFTHRPTPEEAAAGAEAARRFGYDASVPLSTNGVLAALLRSGTAGIALFTFLYAAALTLVTLRILRSLFRTASRYADLAEQLVEGRYETEAQPPAEGVFSRLAHQFQLMAKRLQHTMERLQQEKSSMKDFLQDISHQLKTPLSALQMFTELAQDDELEPAKRREFLQKGESQISRMDWLIRQLLTVARMEAGTTRLNRTLQPLRHTVEEAAAILTPLAEQRGVVLRVNHPDGSLCLLEHDSAWLGEAIGNLVKNGIEHSPEGGCVDLTLSETSVLVRLEIRDTGPGIPAEDLPRLFQRFYRGRSAPATASSEASRSAPGGGAGIGLALAKAIIEQHGGFVTVRSEAGAGAVFTVTLPREMTKS